MPELICVNCGHDVHIPDDKTGLIHIDGKYACHEKGKRLSTVAEVEEN